MKEPYYSMKEPCERVVRVQAMRESVQFVVIVVGIRSPIMMAISLD